MSKYIFLIVYFVFLTFASRVFAQDVSSGQSRVNIYFFWDSNCPHCEREDKFLSEIASSDPQVLVHRFEVKDQANGPLLAEMAAEYGQDFSSVPVTFIGSEYMVGYESDETSGQDILNLVEELKVSGDPDEVGKFIFDSDRPDLIESTTQISQPSVVNGHWVDKLQRSITGEFVLGVLILVILTSLIIAKIKGN